MPESLKGNIKLFGAIDRLTKKVWLLAAPNKNAEHMVKLINIIGTEIKVLENVVSDNGMDTDAKD